MTSKFTSIADDSFLKSISITFTPELFTDRVGAGGVIGLTFEIAIEVENLEKFISSKAGYALTQLYMNSIISEPTGCGAGERQSPEKMKRNTQSSLMRSLESLLENLERLTQR